jgi:hypothetical protein
MNITILLLVSDPIVRSILKKTLEHEGWWLPEIWDGGRPDQGLPAGSADNPNLH